MLKSNNMLKQFNCFDSDAKRRKVDDMHSETTVPVLERRAPGSVSRTPMSSSVGRRTSESGASTSAPSPKGRICVAQSPRPDLSEISMSEQIMTAKLCLCNQSYLDALLVHRIIFCLN